MKKGSLLLALLLCTSAFAQTPTQVKGFFGQGQTSYTVPLDKPTVAGQAIFIYVYAPGAQWLPGPVCDLAYLGNGNQPFCNYNLFDLQGNQFVSVNRDNPTFVYTPSSRGGADSITITFSLKDLVNLSLVVMVFPDTLVLQDVTPSECNFSIWGKGNQICNPVVSGGSTIPNDETAMPASAVLVSSIPNELFIGIGHGEAASLTASNGWASLVVGGEIFFSYKTDVAVGTQESFTLTASPALEEGDYCYLGIQGFKVIPIQ